VNTLKISGVVRLTKRILFGTAFFECLGAVLLATRFIPRMGWKAGLYNAVFHSVSAFCNAGFDLMGRYGEYSSLTGYVADPVVNLTIMALIIIGGIGFIVWDDIRHNGLHFRRYMLHTKLVLCTTAVLIFGGALLIGIVEQDATMAHMSAGERILASLFASVTARTAGFNTIDTGSMTRAGLLITMVLMFIGGSTGSTAGGVKTTTVAAMLLHVRQYLRGDIGTNVFGRRLEDSVINKATLVCTINLLLATAGAIAILAAEPSQSMADVLFEVFSAIGTAGMSTGITRSLCGFSRYILIFLMYCGRIGSMTFALSFTHRRTVASIRYPVEKITVG
jgi:trk system potassium uptake protein TrkH